MRFYRTFALLLLLSTAAGLGAQLSQLENAGVDEGFSILYQVREEARVHVAPPRILSEAEHKAVQAYVSRAVKEPYPKDPMHGVNRGYDLSVQWALELLGDDEMAIDSAAAIAARDDVSFMLRQGSVKILKGHDERLRELKLILQEPRQSLKEEADRKMLLAKVILSKESLNSDDAKIIASLINTENEYFATILREMRFEKPKDKGLF